jgi:diguanylate cyclase (GGDEF)-like protein
VSTTARLLGFHGRALVVDDDATPRLIARRALEEAGLAVTEAANGIEAMEAFREVSPDIVVLDAEMPRLDGFEACARIRALPGGRRVPIVMVTSTDDLASIDRAFEAGATDFLTKPVPLALLGHKAAYLIRAARIRAELSRSEERHNAVLAAVPDVLLELDAKGVIERVFGAGDRGAILGAETLEGRGILELVPQHSASAFAAMLSAARQRAPAPEVEFELASSLGGATVEARAVPYREDGALLLLRDVSERRRALERIRELAYTDALTGLPNLEAFRERLDGLAAGQRAGKRGMGLLHVDIDHFERINESFGQKTGDAVLRAVAMLLRRVLDPQRTGALVARFSGDEFSILLPEITVPEEAEVVAHRIGTALSAPLMADGVEVWVTASIGIATAPEHGCDLELVDRHAHTAATAAKEAGGNRIQAFDATLERSTRARLALATELRRAVERGELALAFQPQVDLRKRRLAGFEVLVRWPHPRHGWVPPAQFVPIAEESALIVSLSEWVLDAALTQLREWTLRGFEVPRVAVNLSSAHFARADVALWVEARLNRHGVPPSRLELEITEGLLMRDAAQTTNALEQLKELGVRLAVDDFGTGYSALAYLKRFALDALKIDRSFVTGVAGRGGDAVICSAIIAMAHRLGLEVIAEGVETAAQLEFLRGEGCDTAQGYLLGKPMPVTQAEALLHRLQRRGGEAPPIEAAERATGTAAG